MGIYNKNPHPARTRERMLFDQFRNDFTSSAFKTIKTVDGPLRKIVGKLVDIEIIGDKSKQVFDIWIVRPDREPIGVRKLNHIIKTIQSLPEYFTSGSPKITVLDGEAYLQTSSPLLVREIGFLTGINRRRCYSESTRQARRAQLAKLNSSRCVA